MTIPLEASTGSDIVLAVDDLTVHYGSRPALTGVTTRFRRGRITAIVGPSGCGKSTFLAALNRLTDLILGCRVSGRIALDGRDIHGADVDPISLRRRVGMIFQTPTPFPLSIRENVTLALREHGVRDRGEREAILRSVLERVGLWDEVAGRLDESALPLSGGQKQRLCLARALALEPEVLLMDEPCSALDPMAAATVERLIRELAERYTILIVTHNLPQAKRLADDLAFFWFEEGAGRLIEQGPAKQVFNKPTHPLTAAYVHGECG